MGAGTEDLCARRVSVPTHELISWTNTGGKADALTISGTEIHLLAGRTPLQIGIITSIRMKENTVLNLTPLGIHPDTANRHCSPYVGCCAAFIQVPSFENISLLVIRKGRDIACICSRNRHTMPYEST